MAKGNADCHIPNDRYREGWERIYGRRQWPGTEYSMVRRTDAEMLNEGLKMLERESEGGGDDGAE